METAEEQENSLLGCLMFDQVENLESFLRVTDMATLLQWRDGRGRGVLHWAARQSPECLRVLLREGGATEVNQVDGEGLTPLMVAVVAQSLPTVDLLLATPRIDLNLLTGPDAEPVLHEAVSAGNVLLAERLMLHGADPTITDIHGESAFVKCADAQMFATLCRAPYLEAAMFAAAERGDADLMTLILDRGASLSCTLPGGKTALMVASANNHAATAKVLLSRHVDVNAQGPKGRTALLYAANRNALACAKLLIHAGADGLIEAADEARRHGFVQLEAVLRRGRSGKKSSGATKSPLEHVRDALSGSLTKEQLAVLPKKWHLIGHVILLQGIDPLLVPVIDQVGEAYLTCRQIKGETVAVEEVAPHGELRVPTIRRVAGREDTLTKHVEDGVKYWIDPLVVMFSSGNGTERMHFRRRVELTAGDLVVDMFAGIGYFSVPLCLGNVDKRKNVHVYSLEKNPNSCRFLRMNVIENGVADMLTVLEGDNREVGQELVGRASRVLMGYIPTPVQFIPRALSFLDRSKGGGIIHYHYTSTEEDRHLVPERDVGSAAASFGGWTLHRVVVRAVKSYGPRVMHYVGDCFLTWTAEDAGETGK